VERNTKSCFGRKKFRASGESSVGRRRGIDRNFIGFFVTSRAAPWAEGRRAPDRSDRQSMRTDFLQVRAKSSADDLGPNEPFASRSHRERQHGLARPAPQDLARRAEEGVHD
jgi:hypothetical protein